MPIVPLTILIFVLLNTAFNSIRDALLIMANVSFAHRWHPRARAHGQIPVGAIGDRFDRIVRHRNASGVLLVSALTEQRANGAAIFRADRARHSPAAAAASDRMQRDSRAAADAVVTRCWRGDQHPLTTIVVGPISATLLTLVALPMPCAWVEERGENHRTVR